MVFFNTSVMGTGLGVLPTGSRLPVYMGFAIDFETKEVVIINQTELLMLAQ